MAKKTVPFNKSGIQKLPDDKPVVYKILSKGGNNNYTGVAKPGRVKARITEHLQGSDDAVPGAKVIIEQIDTITEAKQKEANIIKRAQPKYNKKGK